MSRQFESSLYYCLVRYLSQALRKDLAKKMVLLAGPRQVGKSTLAKGLLNSRGVYLNWDVRKDQTMIRQQSWPKNASLVVLDEIHKSPKWKNFLKGLADEFSNTPPVLVTGSAKLDTYRKSGDALTGRAYLYHLHPIDPAEAAVFLPALTPNERLTRLLAAGGFPEAFLNPDDAERLLNDRLDVVVREDLRDLSRVGSLRAIQLLVELLRERVGGPISLANLAQDLSVSAPTVRSWIEILERLYLVFRLQPFAGGLARGLRKESKLYFYDCSAGPVEARLENAVACALLKFCEYQRDTTGKNFALHYFRDREGREVDFVVTLNRKPHWCIEVKGTEATLSPSLRYLHQRFKPARSVQLVRTLDRPLEIDGVTIAPLGDWCERLGR
jgi:predicted AAA+ superfamily ATPase